MSAFGSGDERLDTIGFIPLRLGPEIEVAIMEWGFQDGCLNTMQTWPS